GAAGVMFTLDTESGFRDAIFVTSSYGLGETVVQGAVNPDEFYVHKPMLREGRPAVIRRNLGSKLIKMIFSTDKVAGKSTHTVDVAEAERHQFSIRDEEVLELARFADIIEKHYERPMDIEWGRDGTDGRLYILQARPETVKSQESKDKVEKYALKSYGKVLASGRAIGQKIGVGPVRVVSDPAEMNSVKPGDVLVADMTDPNWEPVMKRASAIVTNRGGRTCHAAIIARELGIPAIVGCGDATDTLTEGEVVTVSCAEGDTGHVYRGAQEYEVTTRDLGELPKIPVKIMMNVGNPELAFDFAQLPNDGVGLARVEFIINNIIGIHPKAILEIDRLPASKREEIERRARGYADPVSFFTDKLVEGVATIAAAFWPKPVIVRLSDFKSNEYRKLLGGDLYEPEEENPMLGFRGASRYIAQSFQDCFAMECRAMRTVREIFGYTNVQLMVPFVRTLGEAAEVEKLLASHGLRRGEHDLKLIMMCEIPSNALLADQFLEYFDGMSIGSNDLTQLTLGLDRDSGLVASLFDERDPAVKILLERTIESCNKAGKYVGICGQGPSDHPDLAEWLTQKGIASISLNPDTVVDTWQRIARLSA
ncbi:MAG: phosphoenolpyruvate synthase, partial [Pseudomonadota bacterium]